MRRYIALDRDERFSFLRGFRAFDLNQPEADAAVFPGSLLPDVVVCDPPYLRLSVRAEQVRSSEPSFCIREGVARCRHVHGLRAAGLRISRWTACAT